MGRMHQARALLDPSTEEAKAADKMFMAGRRHFIPDTQTQQGQMPSMATGAGGLPPGGMPPGGMPPMGGGNQLPIAGRANLPTGPVPTRGMPR